MKEKKLLFVWDWDVTHAQFYSWNDGLRACLQVLKESYDVQVNITATTDIGVIKQAIDLFKPTHILAWGSLDRPSFSMLAEYKNIKKALCFAGGTHIHENSRVFDTIFVENSEYVKRFAEEQIPVFKAFGTNTKLFNIIDIKPKWDVFYPATYIKHKRHDFFLSATEGYFQLLAGKFLPEDKETENLVKAHKLATILPEVSYSVLPYLYAQSHCVFVPALENGGGQRAVLESLACGKPVIVMDKNPFTREFVQEGGYGRIATSVASVQSSLDEFTSKTRDKDFVRSFVKEKYSEQNYAYSIYSNFIE